MPDFIQLLKDEWHNVKAAPLAFIGALAAGAAGGFYVADYHYSGRIAELVETLQTKEFPAPRVVTKIVNVPTRDPAQALIIQDLNRRLMDAEARLDRPDHSKPPPVPNSGGSVTVKGDNSGNACAGNAQCNQEAPAPTCSVEDQGNGHFLLKVKSPYPAHNLYVEAHGIQDDSKNDQGINIRPDIPGGFMTGMSGFRGDWAFVNLPNAAGTYIVTVMPAQDQKAIVTCRVQ